MTEKRYGKIADELSREVILGTGVDDAYYASIGMQPLEVEQAWDGRWYLAGYAPAQVQPTVQEKVAQLEARYAMNRWQRAGILASPDNYSALTVERAREIEALAAPLREATP